MPHSPRCQTVELTEKRKIKVFEYNLVTVKPLSYIPMAHAVRKIITIRLKNHTGYILESQKRGIMASNSEFIVK